MPPLIPRDDADDSDDEDKDIVQNCSGDRSDQDISIANTLGDTPLLVPEPEVRCLERSNRAPERYDPSSGESYVQVCHNILSQVREEKRCLEYEESETKFVAHVLTKLRKDFYAQQFMIGRGLKEFKEEGPPTVKSELSQMHQQR